MTKKEIKAEIINACKSEIEKQISFNEKQSGEEQKTANLYKGAMSSRHDTFKEEAQARKEIFNAKIINLLKLKSELRLLSNKTCDSVVMGAIVETTSDNYFIFCYLFDDNLEIGGREYSTISIDSPIGKALADKKVNEKITFNQKEFVITDIY